MCKIREASNRVCLITCMRERERERGLARASKCPRGTVHAPFWAGRVRRAEAVTAFLGGLSGTRLPALSYLLHRARHHSSDPPFPLFGARLPPPDQIGRTRYRGVSVASTGTAFPRRCRAAFFSFLFPSASAASSCPRGIFTFARFATPRKCRSVLSFQPLLYRRLSQMIAFPRSFLLFPFLCFL